jgi:hypothetical protein
MNPPHATIRVSCSGRRTCVAEDLQVIRSLRVIFCLRVGFRPAIIGFQTILRCSFARIAALFVLTLLDLIPGQIRAYKVRPVFELIHPTALPHLIPVVLAIAHSLLIVPGISSGRTQ